MNVNVLIDGLISYLFLLILLTFHEFGHAWMAMKRGDDTARLMGRVSLNPLVHIDMLGTVILPLVFTFMAAFGGGGAFLFGWAKPVPFDPRNLKNPKRDSILIAMAGPAMNLLLAVVLMALMKTGQVAHSAMLEKIALQMTELSLVLCFFNLIPVPPLDGSHVLRHVVGMSDETYYRFAQYGFLIVIVLLQFPLVRTLLYGAVVLTMVSLAHLFRVAL